MELSSLASQPSLASAPTASAMPSCVATDSTTDMDWSSTIAYHTTPEHLYMAEQIAAGSPELPSDLVSLVVEYSFELQQSRSQMFFDHSFWIHHRRPAADGTVTPTEAKNQCTGLKHHDTVDHCMMSEELRSQVLRGWKMSNVVVWCNHFVNGISCVYQSPTGESTMALGNEPHGDHHAPGRRVFALGSDEWLSAIIGTGGHWWASLTLTTSRGRVIDGLGTTERHNHSFNVIHDETPQSVRIVGLRTGIGGHIHYIGAYYERLYPRTEAEIAADEHRAIPPVTARAFYTNLQADY